MSCCTQKPFKTTTPVGDLCSADGRKVTSIAYFPKAAPSRRVVALLADSAMPNFYYENGKLSNSRSSNEDLYTVSKTKTVYVGVYNWKGPYDTRKTQLALTNGSTADVTRIERSTSFLGWISGPTSTTVDA